MGKFITMTKQDILDAISASPLVQKIHQEMSKPISEQVTLYDFHCLVGDSTTANDQVISFYVFDEGGAGEEAWWRPNSLNSITPEGETFTDVVTAKAQAAKANNIVKAYKFTEVNDEYEWAIATAWQTINGTDGFREYIAYKNNAGTLQFDPTGA